MAEKHLNHRLQHAISHLDPVRVENAVGPGTPDLEFIGGWIESKMLKAWPKRPDTVVKVGHYKPEQRAWHTKRCRAGGTVYVVIQIGTDVLVFDGLFAAQRLGFMTHAEMNRHALCVMYPWDADKFRRFIDSHRGN